ncbi:MAG: hypothetical protein WD037_14695 [Balneolales bacterium]
MRSATGGTAGGRKTKIGTGETPIPAAAMLREESKQQEIFTIGNRPFTIGR